MRLREWGEVMPALTVGVDIGGTKIAAGVVDAEGRVLARHTSYAHAGQPPEAVIAATLEAVQAVRSQAGLEMGDLAAVGVGFPGYVHGAQGRVLVSSNLPAWDNHPLRDCLQERLGLPVVLDNDCNCAAWGEYRYGAGRGARSLCYATLSTGCGTGIVLDGKVYAGATGTAGEIGHTLVDPNGPPCTCGKRGCVMSYASGVAISRMACERVRRGEPTLLRGLCGPDPAHVTGEQVAEAARQGDAVAQEVLAVAGHYFGIGLANITLVLNPDRIVIGGGLARIGPLVLDPCLAALREHVHPAIIASTRIALSELWQDAGMLGAAALAWEHGATST